MASPCAGDNGETVFIDVAGHHGGIFDTIDFDAHGGVEGKWLAISLQGSVIPVGYHHLVNIEVSPPLTACTTKPMVLTKGLLADKEVES